MTVERFRAASTLALLALCALAACGDENADEPTAPSCSVEGAELPAGEERLLEDDCTLCTCRDAGRLSCTDTCEDAGGDDSDTQDSESSDVDATPTNVTDDNDGATDAAPTDAAQLDPSCVDSDEDGYFVCADDAAGPLPAVQDCDDNTFVTRPGGYEFPDNRVDDDCDGDIDEPYQCGCTPGRFGGTDSMIAALDFCDGSIRSTSTTGETAQFTVMENYFGIEPVSGGCFVVMSTGDSEEEPGDGSIFSFEGVQPGTSFSEVPYPDPDPLTPGGSAYDLATWTLEVDVPPNVRGLAFDFMFMSAEYPEYLCGEYNDTFYAVLESTAVNSGERTNISFDPNDRLITVNVGYFEKPTAWTVDLADTPFGVADTFTGNCPFITSAPGCALPDYCDEREAVQVTGSGSGWLRTAAPVTPGETSMRLTFSVHDEGDGELDTLVLLDRFEWLPSAPPIGTAKR
jgi:hypothetical protein